jgi:hypothetical protein
VSVALGTQLAKRMLSSCHLRPLWLCHFFTLTHKRHDFREKVTDTKMCVLIFSTTCARNISHFEINSVRYIGIHVKYSLFLSRFNKIYLKFLGRFWKNTEISNIMKICPMRAQLFHADIHDKANSDVLQFCERA